MRRGYEGTTMEGLFLDSITKYITIEEPHLYQTLQRRFHPLIIYCNIYEVPTTVNIF